MRKNYLLATTLAAALLAGCSSNVKLDPVDANGGGRMGNSTPVTNNGAKAQGVGQGTPGQVQIGGSGGASSTDDMANAPGAGKVVYFDFDSFVVRPEYQPVVEWQARVLRTNPKRHVVLEGHTDERGSREYNLALGQKRAEAVRRSLTILGVNDGQLEAVSFGKEKPAVQGTSEEAYAQNRRVEFGRR